MVCLISITLIHCKTKKLQPETDVVREYDFPLDWIGQYEGTLNIYNAQSDTSTILMHLDIGYPDKSGFYPWTITYGEDDVRAYGLEAVNPQKGYYRIDEFNSIKLDAFVRAGHFTSRFEVMGSDLIVDYCRVNGGMEVRFFISQSQPMSISGGQIFGQDTVPEVKSYNMVAFQKAFLREIKP